MRLMPRGVPVVTESKWELGGYGVFFVASRCPRQTMGLQLALPFILRAGVNSIDDWGLVVAAAVSAAHQYSSLGHCTRASRGWQVDGRVLGGVHSFVQRSGARRDWDNLEFASH